MTGDKVASDFARLKAKLAKLAQRERTAGEARRLKGGDAGELIAALVTEIDETILPRRLTLTSEGRALHLAVANRRLQAMLSPAPDVEGALDLADKALPDAEEPAVQDLKALLERVFATGAPVTISARRLSQVFGSDIGVPANLLARAWDVAEAGPRPAMEPGEVLAHFLDEIGDMSQAWLRIEGEDVTDHKGDEERVAALGEQAAIFLDGYFAKFEAIFPADAMACATMIAPPAGGGAAMLFVEIGDVSAFVVAEPANMGAIAGKWQAMSAR